MSTFYWVSNLNVRRFEFFSRLAEGHTHTHTQHFLLFVRDEQSCVVTERLHSRLSNSCIAQ